MKRRNMKICYPAILFAATTLALSAYAQAPTPGAPATRPEGRAPATPVVRPCSSVVVDPPTILTLGKSQVVRMDFPVARLIVGGQAASRAGRPQAVGAAAVAEEGGAGAAPRGARQQQQRVAPQDTEGVADTEISLLSPTELFFLGKKSGSMNVVLQGTDGRCVVKDIIVTVDPETLQAKLTELMPEETGIKVRGADANLVLTGNVSDALKLEQVLSVAASYGDPKKLVNMLRVAAPQQVMLEVKIAEVSKNLLEQLGASVNLTKTASSGLNTYSLISNFLSGGGGLAQALRIGRGSVTIDAEKQDGVVRVLAEPNIVAISGQPASFLSGGKIFIPVAQEPGTNGGVARITLEEKEFGVGLKFTPTVLDGGRVNLKLLSEVSELSQTGSPFATFGGFTAILPSMTTRRIDTTVQLGDGQSFVVAGLIKNNMTQSLNRFPGLGEVPVMGALFRSTEFQTDQTELMFVVTPRLVKPLTTAVTLPTDNHIVPTRGQIMLMGTGEGAAPAPVRASVAQPTPLAPSTPEPVARPTNAVTAADKQSPTVRTVQVPVAAPEPATPAAIRTSTIESSPVPAAALAPAARP